MVLIFFVQHLSKYHLFQYYFLARGAFLLLICASFVSICVYMEWSGKIWEHKNWKSVLQISFASQYSVSLLHYFNKYCYLLTIRACASYGLGRHLNFSELAQARASRIVGQPQPQPFKYFALNIFREISLILSTTLEVFPASFSDWSTPWEKTTFIHFLYEAVCTQPARI
jgi:hypothetical protein